MIFFTPEISFYLRNRVDDSEKWFRPGEVYRANVLLSFDLSHSCPGETLAGKLKYLNTRWIRIIEGKELETRLENESIHDLLKLVVLNEE